jgi:D-alanyl-D-alanine carboxypeptidase
MRTALKRMLVALVIVVGLMAIATGPFLVLTPRPPKPPPGIDSVEKLEAYLGALVENETPPALDVTVVKDGTLAYSKAFGQADGPAGIPATPDTVYHFWSATKLFTATAIMQLVEDGKVALDDPLTRYLPDFATVYRGAPATVTIRQLLTHTSGIRDLGPTDLLGWIHHFDDPPINQSALVKDRMQSYRKLATEPGKTAAYSNAGYILLGAVVEAASGRSYEDFVRERILGPLGMTSTDFVYRDDMLARAAAGSHPLFHFFTPLLLVVHLDWFTNWVSRTLRQRMWLAPLYTDYTPPTGLIGTGRDLARFGQAFLAGGEIDGRRILRPETAAMLLNDDYGADNQSDGARVGFGWHWWDTAPIPFKGHGGGGPGFGAQIAVFQDQRMVIVILANDTLIDRVGLTNLVASVFR